MALEGWKQKTIEDAIRDGRKNRYVSAQFHLLKCVGLDRPNYEHKLLVKLLLHAGIDKIDNPVWTLPDDEVMAFIKCEKSSLLNALKACREDYLFSHTGPTTARKYRLSIANLVDTMRPDNQFKFYELLGHDTAEIRTLMGPTPPATIPPHGQSAHVVEPAPTTWKPRPGDGRNFHHMGAPNKEEEQLQNRQEEQVKEPVKNRRPEDGLEDTSEDGLGDTSNDEKRNATEAAERIITAIHYPRSHLRERRDDRELFCKIGLLWFRGLLCDADIEDAIEFVNSTPKPRSRAALFQTSLNKSLGSARALNQLLAMTKLGVPAR
jgi:hypothetical protein